MNTITQVLKNSLEVYTKQFSLNCIKQSFSQLDTNSRNNTGEYGQHISKFSHAPSKNINVYQYLYISKTKEQAGEFCV